MNPRWQQRCLLALWLAAPVTHAAAPAVDEDLLEFLGSVDAEENDWSDFLEHSDVERIAKAKARPPAAGAAPPAPAPPPAPPKGKQP